MMSESEFNDFINTTTTRGGSTFNLKTSNCSKQAQEILANANYNALAKAHIGANIKSAYYANEKFKNKLESVLSELNITLIA